MSAVYRSEHAPRYLNEPHIGCWAGTPSRCCTCSGRSWSGCRGGALMRSPTGPPSVRDWLGVATVTDDWGGKERIEDYLRAGGDLGAAPGQPGLAAEGRVEVVSVPAMHNARLQAQGGRFTLCRASIATLEEYVDRFATGVALTKCVRPAAAAARALPDLDAMGVTSAGLFSDLGGTATLATMRAVLQSDLA